MRRDSAEAKKLVASLADAGVVVSGRWLEDRSQDGLLPLDEVDEAVTVAHIAFVKRVHRPGPGAGDRTARLLAANGFSCERYGDHLSRTVGRALDIVAAQFGAEPIDTDTDEGFEQVERAATIAGEALDNEEIPLSYRQPLRDVVGHVVGQPPNSDHEGQPYGTREQLAHSLLTNAAAAVMGTGGYDLSLMAGTPEIHADKLPPAMTGAFGNIGGVAAMARRVLAEVPVWVMVGAAQFTQQLLCAIRFGNDEVRDLMAADLAPFILAMMIQAGRDPLAAAVLNEIFAGPLPAGTVVEVGTGSEETRMRFPDGSVVKVDTRSRE